MHKVKGCKCVLSDHTQTIHAIHNYEQSENVLNENLSNKLHTYIHAYIPAQIPLPANGDMILSTIYKMIQ